MRKQSVCLYIGLYWLSILTGQAQPTPAADSLDTYLRTHSPTDSTYIRVMDKVIVALMFKNADYVRADSMSRQMADISTRIGFWTGLVIAYRNQSIIAQLKADTKQQLVYCQKTLEVAEKHALPPKIIYGSLCNLAAAYDKAGQPEQVLQTALRAIRYQEKYAIKPRYPLPHRLIGGVLVSQGRTQQAIPYYQEAGLIFRELGDPRGIGIFEYQLGDFYQKLNKPKDALTHHRQALKIGEEIKFELLQVDGLNGVALDLSSLNRPQEGIPYAKRALAIIKKQQNQLGVCASYSTLGTLYQKLKDDKQAEAYYKKAIDLANANGYKDELKKASQQLADLFATQKDFQQAYVYQLQKNNLIDSAGAVQTNAEVQRLIARYEAGKKEAQILLLQQEKRLQQEEMARSRWQRNAMLAGAGLLLLLGISAGGWLLNKARIRRLEEAQALRTRIAHDLHDEVGSTLSSISLLSDYTDKLLTQNRPEKAQQMVQKIYTDARQILEAIDEIIWTINPSNDSMARIAMRLREYAQPLMELKGIRLTYMADPTLTDMPFSMESRQHLFLLCKEAINNLVKYSAATEATIRFECNGGELNVLIEDNGQGFRTDATRPARTGQLSMQHRAEAIGGKLVIESAPGRGTRMKMAFTG